MAHGSNVFFLPSIFVCSIISSQFKKRFSIKKNLIEKTVKIWQKNCPKSLKTVSILCGEIFFENKFPQEFGIFLIF
jgi:hypothetical protein